MLDLSSHLKFLGTSIVRLNEGGTKDKGTGVANALTNGKNPRHASLKSHMVGDR